MKEIINSDRVKAVMFVLVTAVVRILDVGGWLDTWFAGFGEVFSLGVFSRYFCSDTDAPFLGVDVLVNRQVRKGNDGRVTVIAADPAYNIRVPISDLIAGRAHGNLILAMLSLMPLDKLLPEEGQTCDVEIRIMSPFRPGASVGTSAAVTIAVGKAINELLVGLGHRRVNASRLATLAFRAEVEVLDQQSGTQDQNSAARKAGPRFMRIRSYPKTSFEHVRITRLTGRELLAGLMTIEVGPHVSTVEHGRVIKEQEGKGPDSPELKRLRPLAARARKCLEAGDLVGFGRAMKANTQAQRMLCPGLVGPEHQRIIDLAKKYPACLGWKVNGAGGDGGSITLLFASRADAVTFYRQARKIFTNDDFLYYEHSFSASA